MFFAPKISEAQLELSFAIIATTLILTLGRIVAIKYGDAKITHITMRPYYVSLGLLTVMLIENLYFLLQVEIFFSNNWNAYFQSLADNGFDQFLIQLITQSKFVLIICFVMGRTFEHEILDYFIRYQGRLKLQHLEVEREGYQRKEKVFSRIYHSKCIGISLLPTIYAFQFLFSAEASFIRPVYFWMYWMFVLVLILAYY